MNPENMEGIRNYLTAFEAHGELPENPQERLRYLSQERNWLHAIQELTLNSIESNWHQQQVARGEQYGD